MNGRGRARKKSFAPNLSQATNRPDPIDISNPSADTPTTTYNISKPQRTQRERTARQEQQFDISGPFAQGPANLKMNKKTDSGRIQSSATMVGVNQPLFNLMDVDKVNQHDAEEHAGPWEGRDKIPIEIATFLQEQEASNYNQLETADISSKSRLFAIPTLVAQKMLMATNDGKDVFLRVHKSGMITMSLEYNDAEIRLTSPSHIHDTPLLPSTYLVDINEERALLKHKIESQINFSKY